MAMTPMAILKNVDFGRHERAEYVKIVGLKHGKSKKTGLFKAISKAYSRRQGSAHAYHYACAITQLDKKSHVRVSCSCPDFCFRWEYFLWKRGAAEIYYCNGEAPQNPGKAACCKHLVMTFKTLFEKGLLNGDLTFK
jgi:hypothetical protein